MRNFFKFTQKRLWQVIVDLSNSEIGRLVLWQKTTLNCSLVENGMIKCIEENRLKYMMAHHLVSISCVIIVSSIFSISLYCFENNGTIETWFTHEFKSSNSWFRVIISSSHQSFLKALTKVLSELVMIFYKPEASMSYYFENMPYNRL